MKKFTLRLSDELHEKLKIESFKTGVSINESIVKLLEDKYKKIAINEKGEMQMTQIDELSREGISLQKKLIAERNYKDFSNYSAKMTTPMKKLMESLKKEDQGTFMNELISLYSSVSEPVPKIIIETLSELDWVTKMYAFLVGLHGQDSEQKGKLVWNKQNEIIHTEHNSYYYYEEEEDFHLDIVTADGYSDEAYIGSPCKVSDEDWEEKMERFIIEFEKTHQEFIKKVTKSY